MNKGHNNLSKTMALISKYLMPATLPSYESIKLSILAERFKKGRGKGGKHPAMKASCMGNKYRPSDSKYSPREIERAQIKRLKEQGIL